MGKNWLKEAREILNNDSFGSSFNNLRPSPNVELFIRRAKFSELISWKVRRLSKSTSPAEWVWIIQHVLSALHLKTSPMKSEVFIRLCEEKRGFYHRFWTLMKFIVSSNCHTSKRKYRKKRSSLALFYVLECFCHCYREENNYATRSICSREWTILKNCTQTLSYEFYNLTKFKFTKNYQVNSKTINRINEN